MYFDDMLLEEIRQRNDIVDIVSMYTDLKVSGGRYLGLCPFHKEKTPSFFVNQKEQLYYCFGCHEGGNVITFVEKINNLDFVEAVKFLADRAGISLPEEDGRLPQEFKEKKSVYDVNKTAAHIFHSNLMNNEKALSYFTDRGLSLKTIKSFGLGYAKDSFNSLTNELAKQNFSEDVIIKAGLAVRKNDKYFDFFRNRVIFPVIDLRGNVIAFGGRVMDGSLPKYLNTGETDVFKKRQNLFALNIAKNSGKDYILLAEGYMDVISLHKHGFNSAVASLGTSFCEEHAKLLKRYTKRVIICYDSDEAGQNAVDRAAEYLMGCGITVKVANLQGGKDPDEILKKYGSEYFDEILEKAPLYMDFLFEREKRGLDLFEMEDKISYARKATSHLSLITDALERELYIKKLSSELDISEDIIRNEYKKNDISKERNEEKKKEIKENIIRKAKTTEENIDESIDVCEGELINILVNNPIYYKKLASYMKEDFFSSAVYNKVYGIIKELMEKLGRYDVNMVLDRLPDAEKSKIAMVCMRNLKYDLTDRKVVELIKRIGLLKQKAEIEKADSLEDLNKKIAMLRRNK